MRQNPPIDPASRPASTGPDLQEKTRRLAARLAELGRVLVAYSGGVDSSFLLAFSVRELGGDRVLAVTGDSATLPRAELEAARALARQIGAVHEVIPTEEMGNLHFLENPSDRCFWCKDELFGTLKAFGARRGFSVVVDGSNADDQHDHRPGARAARRHDVISPLADAGLAKQEIRRLSKDLHLPTWDKPAMACLASRVAYGERISPQLLQRIEEGEAWLRGIGFANVRVRAHGTLCRIEVDRDRIADLLRHDPGKRFKALGFSYVTVDVEGFRSGSMNADLALRAEEEE